MRVSLYQGSRQPGDLCWLQMMRTQGPALGDGGEGEEERRAESYQGLT